MRVWSTMLFLMTVAGVFGAAGAPVQKVLLVTGQETNVVAQGLRTLRVEHQCVPPARFAALSPFDYDLIVWGMDESRSVLDAAAGPTCAFVHSGGVLVCFRHSGADAWLPVPVKRDKSYAFGEILRPAHPLFSTPHRLTRDDMRQVHGGSIYEAFHELGAGWTPLVSTGAEQGWDKRAALSGGPHYGIVELSHGAGCILLVQMIPAYHWFTDSNGDAACAGARLFENIVCYATARAPARAATRPPRVVPDGFVTELADVLRTPQRGDGMRMDDAAWRLTAQGPYTARTDRRGVLTFTHPDTPAEAGNFIQVTRSVELPPAAGGLALRWYASDTYCGGRERILGGKDHGKTAAVNEKQGLRFVQVLVNGETVWEEDVFGRNPQPARSRVRMADITAAVRKAGGACDVTLRLEDRHGSGADPFAIDVFWGVVEVIPGLVQRSAADAFTGTAFTRAADGALTLDQPRGTLGHRCEVPEGTYRVAVQLRDDVNGRSRLRLSAASRSVAEWTLTADDQRLYWAVSEPVRLAANEILELEAERDGDEAVLIRRLAILPDRVARDAPDPAAAPATAGVPPTFRVTVTESAAVARAGEITAQGLPFARAALRDPAHIRVADSARRAVPCQARTVATWPDGSVKIALVCFPADTSAGETVAYRVDATAAAAAAPVAAPALTVSDGPDSLRIDTGRMVVTLSTTHGRIVDDVRTAERVLKPGTQLWELAVEDEHGRVLRSGGATVTATQVVERGPLRALIVRRGTLSDQDGSRIEYRLQLEATAGSDALGLHAIIVNREDTPEVYLNRWSMQLDHEGAAQGSVWLSDTERRAANPGAVLYQHTEKILTWTGADGTRSRVAGRSPGYVRLPAVAIGTRWFWQRFPQAVRFEADTVRFDFIPRAFDDQDLPTRWRDRMHELTDAYTVGGVGYPQSPGKMGVFRFAQGEALSQEVRFVFDAQPPDAPVRDVMAPLVDRLRAVSEPAYTAATRAFGEFCPQAPQAYPAYEQSLTQLYDNYLAKREKRREYGFENFGDDTFEWGYGPSYTFWSNSEYDHHHGFALQYLRSGEPRWWELCEQQARMYRDVVVIHHAPAGALLRGGPRHHNATAQWMPQHDEQCWVADHTRCGPSAGHSWAEGMIDYWFLTGDPWAEEVVREMADWYCDIAENNKFGAGGQERGPGWALIAISALAGALGDARLMAAGDTVAGWIVSWQDPIRGVVSVPISEQPSYEGGSTFMHGIVGRALGRWYDVTGAARVRDACIGIAEWITTEPMGKPGQFWYKQSPNNSKRYGATDQCLTALTYASVLSGDPWFETVATALLRQTRAGGRSISWYPQALAQLLPSITPAAVEVTPGELDVAPDRPGAVEVSVRNTTDVELTAAVTAATPAPFRLAQPPVEFTVPAGATGTGHVGIACTAAPGSGTVVLRVRLTSAGQPAAERILPVVVRAVKRIVRIEAGVAAAQVSAPMVVAGQAVEAYAHTPRRADFVAKPHAPDGAVGGAATWTLELPVETEYELSAEVKWRDDEGNSFYLSVDGGPEQVLGNTGAMNQWLWVAQPRVRLTAGRHTFRIRSREDGAQVRRICLSGVEAE